MFKNFFRFFLQNKQQVEDLKPLTDYLKTSHNFQKVAYKIHFTKEGMKDRMMNSLEGLLKEEDEIKMIEEDNKNGNKRK